MARRKKNDLEAMISREYTRQAEGKQIDIMKIVALFADVKASVQRGTALDAAVSEAIATHCEPA